MWRKVIKAEEKTRRCPVVIWIPNKQVRRQSSREKDVYSDVPDTRRE